MKEVGLDETGLGLKQFADLFEHNNKHSGSVIIGIFYFLFIYFLIYPKHS
jgi:hypothetical protein